MAKVTTNRAEAVIPPRTFTVELSEIEMAALVLLTGRTNDVLVKRDAETAFSVHDAWETGPAGKYIVDHFSDLSNYNIYASLRDAFNA